MDQFLDKINIKYKIISVDESEQSIVVRYWTDFLSEEELAIDAQKNEDGTPVRCKTDYNFNIWDSVKTEKDLDKMITSYAPIEWFKLQYKVKNPDIDNTINGSLLVVKGLLNKTHEKEVELNKNNSSNELNELSDEDIEKLLSEILEKQTTN